MNRLKEIFDKQKGLMEKYHEIEKESGLMTTEDCPIDLDDQAGQQRLRDFAWRFVEEIGETLESFTRNKREVTDETKEEFIDCLHFLTELTILAGWEHYDVCPTKHNEVDNLYTISLNGINKAMSKNSGAYTLEVVVTELIMDTAMMINTLKNKAWKQSMRETNAPLFYDRLYNVWESYFALLAVAGIEDQEVYELYVMKNEKNKQRQLNNY